MRRSLVLMIVVLTFGLILFSSCGETDVIGKVAVTSFKTVLDTIPDKVKWSDKDESWVIESEKGDLFKFAGDFSRVLPVNTVSNIIAVPDFQLELDAAPFIKAGLNSSNLPPQNNDIAYFIQDGKLMLHFNFGQAKFTYSGTPTPLDTFKQIVANYRTRIGYHQILDHYGIALGNGNMFEWAKDMSKNDKDIVYVLNPEPFIKAGVDPKKVEGWVFAKIEIVNDQGKKQLADKLLRPYNLK